MKAEIITIGDEILIGQIIDSNSNYIAQKLNSIGFEITKTSSISDNKAQINKTLQLAQDKVSLVIITGGLGPTKDDITKAALCEYFDSELIISKEVEKHVLNFLSSKGISAKKRNLRQAEVPSNCEIIPNQVGTAPGMWFEKNNTVFISLPGIPFEMKTIFETELVKKLQAYFKTPNIIHRTIMTIGIPESMLADKLSDWENNLPDNIKLAYLPSPEAIRLRLSGSNNNKNELEKILNTEIEKLQKIIPKYIFATEQKYLQEVIGDLLKEQKKTVSTAESCSGGTIGKLITSIPGCSQYFEGSIIAYSNKIKETVLNVKKESLINYGAVSQAVIEEMAKNALALFKTDYSVATSGVAGPAGGSKDKPVGTVWIAVASKDKIISKKFNFGEIREIVVRRSSSYALNMLRLLIATYGNSNL